MDPESVNSTSGNRIFRIDLIELDLDRYEVRRAGHRLRLSRVPMELLILLVKRRGLLVTRDEIVRHLWTEPESIDTVQGLNAAVTRVRALLNDDPSAPRYIETVIGKGYRFIAEVEELPVVPPHPGMASTPAAVEAPPQTPKEAPTAPVMDAAAEGHRARGNFRRPLAIGLIAAILCLAVAALLWIRRQHEPDHGVSGLIQLTNNGSDNLISASAVSGDGETLAYADAEGLYLRTKAGTISPLIGPSHFDATSLYWIAGDSKLLVSGFAEASRRAEVWLINRNGKPAQLIKQDARNALPSPDEKKIAYTNVAGTQMFAANLDGTDAIPLLSAQGHDTFSPLLWSSNTLLHFERQHFWLNVDGDVPSSLDIEENYRWEHEVIDIGSKQVIASDQDLRMDSACPPFNGKILFVAKDNQYYLREIDINSQTGRLILPAKKLKNLQSSRVSSLSCSAENKIATAVVWRGQPDTYFAEVNGRDHSLTNIRKLTVGRAQDYPHAWTPDSQTVIFESDRLGAYSLFAQGIAQTSPELLVHSAADNVLAQVTPDGKWILYMSMLGPKRTLMRLPITGGTPEQVPIDGMLDEFRCPLGGKHGCVLRETRTDQEFVYYALDPIRGKGAELTRRKWTPSVMGDWDISPDSCVLAYPSHDSFDTRISLLPLRSSGCVSKPRDISLTGVHRIWGVVWDAEGTGLYVALADWKTFDGKAPLLFTDLKGNSRQILKTVGISWAVPSPDGKRLAFWMATPDRNVWRVQ
jgi:DNA-binding winged helix-turn-helix (wHTH) protein/Tol biopolymer transport system component